MRQKLNMITLGVSDFGRSLEFYEKTLGWKKSPASQENLALFPLGGIVLALYPKALLAEDANVEETGAGFSGITFSCNFGSEEEVDRVFDELREKGVKIARPPQKAFWGGYSGYFQDPDGYLIEAACNPFWELDEDHNLRL